MHAGHSYPEFTNWSRPTHPIGLDLAIVPMLAGWCRTATRHRSAPPRAVLRAPGQAANGELDLLGPLRGDEERDAPAPQFVAHKESPFLLANRHGCARDLPAMSGLIHPCIKAAPPDERETRGR